MSYIYSLPAELPTGPPAGGSIYGKGDYGHAKYGLAPIYVVAGDLAPSVVFSATALSFWRTVGGNLAPAVVFFGELNFTDLRGDLAPQITLGGPLTADRVLTGDSTFGVVFAAQLASGPLWVQSIPEAPPWQASDSCPPPLWTPSGQPADAGWQETELCRG